jgi:general secretion pathway protein D
MKTNAFHAFSNMSRILLARGALGVLLGAAPALFAQFPPGGFGRFGPFNNFNRNNAANTSQYNNNGTVGNATIYVDPDTKNLVVIADEQTGMQISNVLAHLDQPKPQVLIKVVFLQVQHNNGLDIGVEGEFSKNIGSSANPLTAGAANVFGLAGLNSLVTNVGPVNFQALSPPTTTGVGSGASGLYQILGSDFQATLRAIAAAGKAQVLSRPSILARDGQPATIVVGQSVPLVTSVSYAGLANTPVNNITYTDVGIILKVTPYISPGYVEMILQPQDSSIDPTLTEPIAAGVNAPVIDETSADTVVVTPDGQTVVIGGLMGSSKNMNESKVPILGDIPLLGNLFKHKTSTDARNELLIFLTPHIVPMPSELPALTASEQQHMLVPKSYSEQELDRFLEHVPVKKQ